MNEPAISFLVCTRNRSQTVYECVLELLASPRNDIEVVVRDNCSTDNTLELLNKISDSRLSIHKAPENQGTLSFFEISKLANGRVVTWLSDEDSFHFEHLDFILSKFEDPASTVMFGSIIVGKAAGRVNFSDESIIDPVRANQIGLLFSGCGGLFVRQSALGCANSFNVSNADDAYTLWNYYPVGFFASRSIKRTLITTSRVVVTQTRFANTTHNWSKLATAVGERLPHYYPESVLERLSSNITNVLFKNLPISTKTRLIYQLIKIFHLQTDSYYNPVVIKLLSDNYQQETVQRYVEHVTRLRLNHFVGKFLWRWTKTLAVFLSLPKKISQWRTLMAK